jgi:hypothetical protein
VSDPLVNLRLEEVRSEARLAAYEIIEEGDPGAAVEQLKALGMKSASAWALGAGLWQIWERIHDEWRGSRGNNAVDRAGLARECAVDLLEAIGDSDDERAYCSYWIKVRLSILPDREASSASLRAVDGEGRGQSKRS